MIWGAFDFGEVTYNEWLCVHAAISVQSGVGAVCLLVKEVEDDAHVVGYYAITATRLVRGALHDTLARGWP